MKQLLYSIVYGLKTVVWCISNFRPPTAKRPIPMEEEECALISRYLENGLKCLKIYSISSKHGHPGFLHCPSIAYRLLLCALCRVVFTLWLVDWLMVGWV